MLETRITACVYGECVSDMPGSKSMVGNRIVYIGTWESHIASQSNAFVKLKKQRQKHCNMAVGLTHSRGVNGVMPIESPRSLEGVNGNEKYCPINSIATKFARLIKRAGLDVPKGTGFYTLRRTAATMAARSGDPFAVQRLLGHANLLMATRYVQDVSKQTDEVIGKNREYIFLK